MKKRIRNRCKFAGEVMQSVGMIMLLVVSTADVTMTPIVPLMIAVAIPLCIMTAGLFVEGYLWKFLISGIENRNVKDRKVQEYRNAA